MTPEQLAKILSDTSEMHPSLVTNFLEPLTALGENCEKRYVVQAPPKNYRDARQFAIALWECGNEEDMRGLVKERPEGAAQLIYLATLFTIERCLPNPSDGHDLEAVSGKPFAAFATRSLQWLDEVESKAAGKTEPLN